MVNGELAIVNWGVYAEKKGEHLAPLFLVYQFFLNSLLTTHDCLFTISHSVPVIQCGFSVAQEGFVLVISP